MANVNVSRNECWRQQKKSNPEMVVIWVREQSLSIERYLCKAKSAISSGLYYNKKIL